MDKGLKILLNAYRDFDRGMGNPSWTEEEFELAKSEGYMFDYPEYMSHDYTLKELKALVAKITPEMAANAFLYSLSTRKLEYRSALGSYWYAVSVPDHKFDKEWECYYCCWSPWSRKPNKMDHLILGPTSFNHNRYKFGGPSHTRLNYALFDLQQFLKMPVYEHTAEDEQILHDILHCVDELAPKNKAGALQKTITAKKILKSNKFEIDILLDILGICGVLSSEEAPCYAVKFVNEFDRSPPEDTNDRAYPLNHWRASDGINTERYKTVFGKDYI